MMRDKITLRTRVFVLVIVVAGLVGAGARSLLTCPPDARTGVPVVAPTGAHASARGARGAVEAAATFVRAGQRIYDLPADQRPDALRALAADAAADGYVAQQSRQLVELDGIAARGNGPLTWDVAVLATRLDAHTRRRARVEIWRLGILSIGGLTAPLAEYTTVAYELVWERGAWRIWSETQTPGPSPMPHPEATPSTPEQLQGALAGFVRYPGGEAF